MYANSQMAFRIKNKWPHLNGHLTNIRQGSSKHKDNVISEKHPWKGSETIRVL